MPVRYFPSILLYSSFMLRRFPYVFMPAVMYIAAMSFADIVHFSLQVADYSSTPQGTPHCPHKSPLNTVLVLSIFSQIVFTIWWVV